MRKILYVLGQLDDLDVAWLSRHGQRRHATNGETLITEGTQNLSLFILVEGELSVSIDKVGHVATLQRGEILGEMGFVDSAPSSATVTAAGDAFVLQISKEALNRKVAADQGFGFRFYRAIALLLADRLRAFEHGRSGSDQAHKDELDEMVLDTVSMAGDRFDRLLRMLA